MGKEEVDPCFSWLNTDFTPRSDFRGGKRQCSIAFIANIAEHYLNIAIVFEHMRKPLSESRVDIEGHARQDWIYCTAATPPLDLQSTSRRLSL